MTDTIRTIKETNFQWRASLFLSHERYFMIAMN